MYGLNKIHKITINEHTIKHSFHFSSKILGQGSSLFVGSLDLDSLFTNIPLKETLDILAYSPF